jgi:regulator of sigma E protease
LNLSWQHLLAFIVAVGVLVTVHEFGHYWVARLLGFKVLRFSVGFGKALWSRVAGQDRTEYVIAAIPLGGYVKLLDEREAPVDPAEQHRAFNRRPHWQRILVLLAGPASSTRMRCQCGRRLKARCTSLGSTGASRSSSSFT